MPVYTYRNIKMDSGFWINAPSKIKGKSYTEDQIRNKIIKGTLKPTSIHKSQTSALKAAKKRSKSFNKKK